MPFHEIEDLSRINKLSKILTKTLQSTGVRSEPRKIGYPGGHTNRKVCFLQSRTPSSLWYTNWITDDKKIINLFGHGVYGEQQTLTIDVQFNYSAVSFSRRLGGVFLEDISTGEVILAHRGIVTLGHRVKKDVLFEAMASRVVEAQTSAGSQEFLLMASLESHSLVEDLSEFSQYLRATVRELGAEIQVIDEDDYESGDDIDESVTGSSATGGNGFEGLRNYFREFAGKRRSYVPKQTYPESNHGKVVDALYQKLHQRGEVLKSRAIDLVVHLPKQALLFEVKTDASTQSIYTAIGQLSVHSPSVATFTDKPVTPLLVVPERPMEKLANMVEHHLNIRIVTYSMSSKGEIFFSNLD